MLSLLAAAFLAGADDPAPWTAPIFHYVRSNIDGSVPEHVVHYRPTRTGIAVYKWVEKCTTAAYVTAEMDDALTQGRFFVAGKVAKDGGQARFGTLTLKPRSMSLSVDVTPPGGTRIEATHSLRAVPYLLYDFDFADLNSFLQERRSKADFSFALPVIWPAEESLFRDFGMLRGHYAGTENHLGRDTMRFDLQVEGSTPSAGTLWVDASDNFIVEASLGLPNHMQYKDFRLVLEKVEAGGQTNWDALTKGQYANCPDS